jgi:putative PIN family toxin of toxin-antitoxin system
MEIGSVTNRRRAVFDTNVFVSAALSKSLTSPTRELLARWEQDEFTLLTCEPLAAELIEKLLDHQIEPDLIARLVASLRLLAEWVTVPASSIIPMLVDPDDDIVLACATLGKADFIVTYDPHFDLLGGRYGDIKIVKALPFLWQVRGDQPPSTPDAPT